MENIPAAAVEDVINFFEDLATSLREQHLSRYAVYSMFHDDAVHYWTMIGEAYARERREDEQRSQDYIDFEWMVKQLKTFETEKTGRAAVVDSQSVRDFLEIETTLDQVITLKSGAAA